MELLQFTKEGIYCPKAEIYIDPWKPVSKAIITHGHADHARWGHKQYLCSDTAKPVIKYRLGISNIESVPYGDKVNINGVQFSFHPAGHIVGSAQVRVEYKGEIWVVSGDYKTEYDGLSEAFEPIKCHHFVTESTFGLPIYKWQAQATIAEELNQWWQTNQSQGKVSVIAGYALGKAQRILQMLDMSIGKVFTHSAIENINDTIRRQSIKLPPTIRVQPDMKKDNFKGHLIIAPPAAIQSAWMRRFGEQTAIGIASGWMALRGARRRKGADRGFVLSDHADWEGLNQAIAATQAERIYVTHGYTQIFKKWLLEKGIWAEEVKTEYQGELNEISEGTPEEEPLDTA